MDFKGIVGAALVKMMHSPFDIKYSANVVTAVFENFSVGIYYSPFEFEIDFDCYDNDRKIREDLSTALTSAGCAQDRLPAFLYMVDEQIMRDYISAHLKLIDEFYDNLTAQRQLDRTRERRA